MRKANIVLYDNDSPLFDQAESIFTWKTSVFQQYEILKVVKSS